MNKIIAAKWTAALRSGGYTQGQNALCRDNSHCCLGVLTELFIKEFSGVVTKTKLQDGRTRYIINDDSAASFLLKEVSDWADIQVRPNGCPVNLPFSLYASNVSPFGMPDLAELNDDDNRAFNFGKIADVIDFFAEDM